MRKYTYSDTEPFVEVYKANEDVCDPAIAYFLQRPYHVDPIFGYATVDNAFMRIGDFSRAQKFADEFRSDDFHRILDRRVKHAVWLMNTFLQKYYWCIIQIEYSTDLVFRNSFKFKQ